MNNTANTLVSGGISYQCDTIGGLPGSQPCLMYFEHWEHRASRVPVRTSTFQDDCRQQCYTRRVDQEYLQVLDVQYVQN
ncbi:hypothetical protein B0H19DRAFT_1152970 [Mycena capillaripes]|nr:hypothetical protein B0H19DRAFT_1152970 [Mycena capillaripes]